MLYGTIERRKTKESGRENATIRGGIGSDVGKPEDRGAETPGDGWVPGKVSKGPDERNKNLRRGGTENR